MEEEGIFHINKRVFVMHGGINTSNAALVANGPILLPSGINISNAALGIYSLGPASQVQHVIMEIAKTAGKFDCLASFFITTRSKEFFKTPMVKARLPFLKKNTIKTNYIHGTKIFLKKV